MLTQYQYFVLFFTVSIHGVCVGVYCAGNLLFVDMTEWSTGVSHHDVKIEAKKKKPLKNKYTLGFCNIVFK